MKAVPAHAAHGIAEKKTYASRIRAWALYDWANHAYVTTTATAFFPPYFIAIATAAFLPKTGDTTSEAAKALARDSASNIFAFVVSLALLTAAVLAPLLGTYADLTDRRKRILITITVLGCLLASSMFVLTGGMWILALVLYFLTQVIVNIALGLNSSLLPHVARPDDLNRASSLGYAFGYIGGGLLLAINTAVFLGAGALGIDDGMAVRLAFLSVGIWWIGFSIPLMLKVPEPKILSLTALASVNPVRETFVQLKKTFTDIRRYKELFKMLVAFWFYMEGVGAIILLASAYGAVLGLDTGVLIGTLLMTQMVAFPYSILYGYIPDQSSKWRGAFLSMLVWTGITLPIIGYYANTTGKVSIPMTFAILAADQIIGLLFSFVIGRRIFARFMDRVDTKIAIIAGLLVYMIVPFWGFFLKTQAEFFLMGWLVGTVQGGTQALSRTIYARLSPPSKSGEFFGLYGLSEKFAGILGPLLYGLIGSITHDPRSSILSIAVFFLLGIYILWKVDVEKGSKIALEEERQIQAMVQAS